MYNIYSIGGKVRIWLSISKVFGFFMFNFVITNFHEMNFGNWWMDPKIVCTQQFKLVWKKKTLATSKIMIDRIWTSLILHKRNYNYLDFARYI